MSKNSIKHNPTNYFLTAIKIGIYVCLFMPLIIGDKFIFPFIFPKQAFFQTIVEVLMVLYLILALRWPQYRPRSSRLFAALVIYFCFMILSAVFGVNVYHSLWSNYERMAGVVSLLHYFGFLFIAANVFKTKEEWFRFFDVSIAASVLEALYGLGQLAGISSFIHGAGGRVDGTIGNPSFLAGYMLINAFFALWLLLEKKNLGWRLFYSATILLNLFIMYQTQTRGALLALVAAVAILSLGLIFAPQKSLAQLPFKSVLHLKKYAIVALIVLILAVGIIWKFRDSDFIKNRPTLHRFANISISMNDTTTRTRLLAWQMSLQGFRERPIFGWGQENYYVVFNKYYNPKLFPDESWFDRSHNAYLDVLVHTGLVGFAAYLSVFILAFWYLWRSWRNERINYQTFLLFIAILVAYGIQNVFLFDTQVTLLMIFSILAFIVFLSRDFSRQPQNAGQSIRPNYFFIGLFILLAFGVFYFANLKPARASLEGVKALSGTTQKQYSVSEIINNFKTAYQIGTFGLPEVAMRANDIASQVLKDQSLTQDEKKQFVEVAIEGLKKSLEMEPLNARYMLVLATLYLSAAQLDPSYLTQADLILQEAQALGPNRQDINFTLGQLRLMQGRPQETMEYLKKAVDLNPNAAVSHWSYGLVAIATGQKDLGQSEIALARELGQPFRPFEISQLISAYGAVSDWPEVVSLYQEWIAQKPNSADPYASLAATYAQMGDKQKAKEAALKAAEIDSSFKAQADEFIQGLGL